MEVAAFAAGREDHGEVSHWQVGWRGRHVTWRAREGQDSGGHILKGIRATRAGDVQTAFSQWAPLLPTRAPTCGVAEWPGVTAGEWTVKQLTA